LQPAPDSEHQLAENAKSAPLRLAKNTMPKLLKYLLIGLLSLVVLLLAAVAVIVATFNPNDYKPRLIELVQQTTGRTLAIPGDIHLTFYPSVGADLGEFSLSGPTDKQQPLVAGKKVHVAVALMPLLSRQVVVDSVSLDGLQLALHRFKDGSTNFDKLYQSKDEAPKDKQPQTADTQAKPVTLDIGSIAITNTSLRLQDDAAGSTLAVTGLTLRTGAIANGRASELEFAANIDTGKPQQTFKVELKTGFTPDLDAQKLALRNTALDLTLPHPAGGTLPVHATGQVDVDLARQQVQATLAGKLDTTTFDLKLGLTQFSPATLTFDIALGELDLDRYTAKTAPQAPSATAPAADAGIDLSGLSALHAHGALKIASLRVVNMKATDVRLGLQATGTRVDINPMHAALYGGTLAGSLGATTTRAPRITATQKLSGIALGPLLKDAIGKTPIDGKGDVSLDISTSGATVSQFKKALGGNASLVLRDGAINGINLAATIRDAKAKIGQVQGKPAAEQGTGSAQDKTDFTELSGSFKIANGVAHNDDLSAKTPLLRLGGSGDINIGTDSLDYTARATIVPSLEGQGGPELQELKGLTVPVRLTGPFNAIGWKIDFGAMVGEATKAKIEEKKAAVEAELKTRLEDKLKGLLGR
jgi:AsmA protein